MDAVPDDTTIHQRRQTLHKMTSGFGLDDAYGTTLDRIREQRGNRVKLGMEALMWIACSGRPLKVEELCHALAVEVGATDLIAHNVPSVRTLLSCTLGLVTIDEQASIARLVHFTLQEYLVAYPSLFITPHSMIAEICLTYLNFQSICELSTKPDTILLATPFLNYASCYWGFHARKDVTEGVKRLALLLLRRDANHISADILLRQDSVGFLPPLERRSGIRPDCTGYTGLHCIAYMGIPEIAIAMVDMKVWDLNARDYRGRTPIMWVAKYGNSAHVELLLEQGDVDPTLSDKEGMTPLTQAVMCGNQDVVKLLLERSDVNADWSDEHHRTPLSYAADAGQERVIMMLLGRCEVDPGASDRFGRTPLSYAAESGHEGVMKLLLERGDINPDSLGVHRLPSPSDVAGSRNRGLVEPLLESGDRNTTWVDLHYGLAAVSYIVGSDPDRLIDRLINRHLEGRGVDKSTFTFWKGSTPLLWAVGSGNKGAVKILLERGDVNPNSKNSSGDTPLKRAAVLGNEGIVRMLLERGGVNPTRLIVLARHHYHMPLVFWT